jgi:hypothetical protein
MGGKTDATETAADLSPDDANALDLLRSLWGDEYAVDYVAGAPRPWQAERRGVACLILTAVSAEGLSAAITGDYEASS